MSGAAITFADVQRALDDRSPEAAALIVSYLEQPDPPEDRAEGADEADPAAADSFTLQRLRTSLHPNTLDGKTDDEKKVIRAEAWKQVIAAPHHPPRLDLGPMLTAFYEGGDAWHRQLLVDVFANARLGWGTWQAFKAIYKRAEDEHDVRMLGVLLWRLDALPQTPYRTDEILPGTVLYMRRRAWRYLRELGRALPDVYPSLAAQVLSHYPQRFKFAGSWVANQIWAHADLEYEGSGSSWMDGPPDDLEKRYAHEAWKAAPQPVLRLLEDANNDAVCRFAIRCIETDFPGEKEKVDPKWLERIARRPLGSVHAFVVRLLEESPELHQSKLAALGLGDMVVRFLDSESEAARRYALAYVRAHVPNLPVDRLVELVEGPADARDFALERLGKFDPKTIGLDHLTRLLRVRAARELATEMLRRGYQPRDLSAEQFIALYTSGREMKGLVEKLFRDAEQTIPAAYLTQLLEDRRCGWSERRDALKMLSTRSGQEIGAAWLKEAVMNPALQSTVSRWLLDGMLSGDALDVEWVKGLVMRPSLRPLAIGILSNPKLVRPGRVGLEWLLAMTRRTDEALASFAHQYLLEHFMPDDFGGIERLWHLATGPKQAEPVRRFAATYLAVHHPVLGPTTNEGRSLAIAPKLDHSAYGLAYVRSGFTDERADVRRLAVRVGRQELVRWGDAALVYELADSRFREGRQLAAEALFGIGDEDAEISVPSEWLDDVRLFALAESHVKATREIALTLIERHYDRVGGARRLAWLMESPDRDVRLFAVRLLWRKHGREGASGEALRQFLRTVLFGLPPGRMERRELDAELAPARPFPASVAKRRLVEVMRDLAIEDRAFADVVVPVFDEFMASAAQGEWQACVAALARIRATHGDVETKLPPAVGEPRRG